MKFRRKSCCLLGSATSLLSFKNSRPTRSCATEKLFEGNPDSLGNPHCGIHGDVLFSAFDPANVHWGETRPFGQAFLRKTSFISMGAYGFAENSSVWRNRMHSETANQQ